jgi:hypothetical protein
MAMTYQPMIGLADTNIAIRSRASNFLQGYGQS